MGSIVRGVKNAFRNVIRAGSIAVILGLSIGMALVMLIALTTIQTKIDSVKSSIGNTITISPAGARGFEGGGEPLTEDALSKVTSTAHVASVDLTLSDRLNGSDDTNLQSSIEAGSLGQRFGRFNQRSSGDTRGPGTATPLDSGQTRTFTPPITVIGVSNPATIGQSLGNSQPTISSGALFAAGSTESVAVVGKALADKNTLTVGSTFKAYNTDIKVVGIYDAGNTFANGQVIMPIASVQTLSDQAGQVSSAVVHVDSISNMAATTKSIETSLGSTADVTSTQDTADQAIAPLENIKTISTYSLIGSLAAGAIIIFMTMLMIVRERRREIGVLKAIGASNSRIVGQFVAEAFTFTVMGGILGIVLGIVLSNPVLQAMANSSSSTTTSTTTAVSRNAGQFGRLAGDGAQAFGRIGQALNPNQALQNLQAQFGLDILVYGLAGILLIAIIGSAIPALLTARVRPAEVLRSE